jgi:hypothetical protein
METIFKVKIPKYYCCKSDTLTCNIASESGDLKYLELARSLDCPWDSTTFNKGVISGNLDVVNYMLKNNCPIDGSTACYYATIKLHKDILSVLHKNGFRMKILLVGSILRNFGKDKTDTQKKEILDEIIKTYFP